MNVMPDILGCLTSSPVCCPCRIPSNPEGNSSHLGASWMAPSSPLSGKHVKL